MSAIDTAKKCQAGYICASGADKANPTDGIKGYICPVGHFCLSGAQRPEPCFFTTYQDVPGQTLSTCKPCAADKNCN